MQDTRRISPIVLAGGALALALAGARCTGKAPAPTPEAPVVAAVAGEEGGHPETFEAAKALAAQRGVPMLVDFYSPT